MKVVFISAFLICSVNSYAQYSPVGKTFSAQVSASCRETTTGGCMIYTYCNLSFEKDSVAIFDYTEKNCISSDPSGSFQKNGYGPTKKYSWKIKDGLITIKDFTDYGNFNQYDAAVLAGKKEMNGKWEELDFTLRTN